MLEFAGPRDIRKLIERNREELERDGTLRHRGATPISGGPVATEHWLNEDQALTPNNVARWFEIQPCGGWFRVNY
jgi:hypothetical protein